MADKTKVLIMGAAGRDFHNFNTFFRDNEAYEVVAFTATQIPYINDRKYPAELVAYANDLLRAAQEPLGDRERWDTVPPNHLLLIDEDCQLELRELG